MAPKGKMGTAEHSSEEKDVRESAQTWSSNKNKGVWEKIIYYYER